MCERVIEEEHYEVPYGKAQPASRARLAFYESDQR